MEAVLFGSPFFMFMIDKVPFTLFGLELLEPMAMITNLIVAISCVYGFSKVRKSTHLVYWRWFFASFALASFFGGLSHLFWNYWGFNGKIAPWFFGVLATSALTFAMVDLFRFSAQTKKLVATAIVVKAMTILFLAFYNWNFLFVAIDTIGSLLLACGLGSWILHFKKGVVQAKFIFYGVLVILPAAFIFLLKFDLHLYMNREDLSHLFIALGLLFFAKFGQDYKRA
jgi:hypothetical protein